MIYLIAANGLVLLILQMRCAFDIPFFRRGTLKYPSKFIYEATRPYINTLSYAFPKILKFNTALFLLVVFFHFTLGFLLSYLDSTASLLSYIQAEESGEIKNKDAMYHYAFIGFLMSYKSFLYYFIEGNALLVRFVPLQILFILFLMVGEFLLVFIAFTAIKLVELFVLLIIRTVISIYNFIVKIIMGIIGIILLPIKALKAIMNLFKSGKK